MASYGERLADLGPAFAHEQREHARREAASLSQQRRLERTEQPEPPDWDPGPTPAERAALVLAGERDGTVRSVHPGDLAEHAIALARAVLAEQ